MRSRSRLPALLAAVAIGVVCVFPVACRREPPSPADLAEAELRAALSTEGSDPTLDDLSDRWLRLREGASGERVEELLQALVEVGGAAADRCPATRASCAVAEKLWLRALELASGELAGQRADRLDDLAWLNYQQGNWQKAEKHSREVLALRRRDGDAVVVGVALVDLGNNLYSQGRYGEAYPLVEEALASYGQAPAQVDLIDRANAFVTLGELRRIRGEYRDAEASFLRALPLAQGAPQPDDVLRAKILNNLGGLYLDQGEYFKAESRFRESLALREGSPDCRQRELAVAHLNIGEVYRAQGDSRRAEELFGRALAEAEADYGSQHSELGWFLERFSQLYEDEGRVAEAIPLAERALTVAGVEESHPVVIQARRRLAHLRLASGEPQQAEELYRQALRTQEKTFGPLHPEVAVTLTGLADSLLQLSPPAVGPARQALDRALSIFAATPFDPATEAEALALRARLERRSGDRRQAFEDLRRSLDLVESLRLRTGGGERARIRFFTRFLDLFQLMVQWQVEDQRLDLAVEYSERARARALVDRLQAARVDLRRDIPPERLRPLLKREAAAKQSLAEVQREIRLAEERPDERAALDALFARLAEADREYAEVEEEILGASRLWRELAERSPVSLQLIQRSLAPPGGALLLYEIGSESSYLFVVPRDPAPTAAFPLMVKASAAEVLGVEPGVLTRNKVNRILDRSEGHPGDLLGILGERPPGGSTSRGDLQAHLHALWRVLLPDPAWRIVAGLQEVVVVPGELYALPFEALVVADPGGGEVKYWIDDGGGPLVRYASSATALDREAAPLAESILPGRGTILSVSDPLFPRPADSGRGSAGAGLLGPLGRLPGTAEETAALVGVFGAADRGGEVVALERADATESAVRQKLPGKRYVHIGTHGIVDDRWSGLFAGLVLTASDASEPSSDGDGFLQLFEIYDLEINCDLVVLSACSTHVGPQVEGEGVFALSRAFSVAGARRVVASLWPVNDRATARLMESFFGSVGRAEQAGRRPSFTLALAEAKRRLRSEHEYSDPYFWAPFVLHGDG